MTPDAPTPTVFRSCGDCAFARRLVPSGRLVCAEAHCNVPQGAAFAPGAYYAGNDSILRSCVFERSLRRGACGQSGRLWTPRTAALPPPGDLPPLGPWPVPPPDA